MREASGRGRAGARWVVLTLLVGVAACGGEDEARLRERTSEERTSSASAATERATERAAAQPASEQPPRAEAAPTPAPTDEVTPTEPAADPAAGLPPIDRAAAAARVLDETVTEALAAAHAAEVGASVCDAAYESAAELVRVVRERFPEEVHDMPPRELFVSHCEQLPAPAQQCMVVRYAVGHEAECRRVQESLSPAQRHQMEQLLRGQ